MGFYWWNALYYGRLINGAAHARLMNSKLVQDMDPVVLARFLRREPVDHWRGMRLLHLPGHFKKVGWIGPVLEPHELKAGEVQWSEVATVTKEWPEAVTEENLALLKELIKEAAPEGATEDRLKPGFYIYQAQWSTLDPENGSKLQAEANIRVVGCPFDCYKC